MIVCVERRYHYKIHNGIGSNLWVNTIVDTRVCLSVPDRKEVDGWDLSDGLRFHLFSDTVSKVLPHGLPYVPSLLTSLFLPFPSFFAEC